jgi:hypothetical protein
MHIRCIPFIVKRRVLLVFASGRLVAAPTCLVPGSIDAPARSRQAEPVTEKAGGLATEWPSTSKSIRAFKSEAPPSGRTP